MNQQNLLTLLTLWTLTMTIWNTTTLLQIKSAVNVEPTQYPVPGSKPDTQSVWTVQTD